MTDPGTVRIERALEPREVAAVRELFREYARSLPVDLTFEGFSEEVRGLPGAYAPPTGALLLARDEVGPVGCAGVRPFGDGDAELKRLYLRPRARGRGVGRRLVEAALGEAAAAGYPALRLDTLPSMTVATALYLAMGFEEIPERRPNPVPGTRYFRRTIGSTTPARGTSK